MENSYKLEAKRILESMRSLIAPQTLVEVDAAAFRHLRLDIYEKIAATLARYNFNFLADLEILEVSQSPTVLFKPPLLRSYLSKDGSILASHYQTVPRLNRLFPFLIKGIINFRWIATPVFFLQQLPLRNFYDFETEFEDGSFLITTNATDSSHFSQPDTIQTVFHAKRTPIDGILSSHLGSLKKRLKTGLRCKHIQTLEQAHATHRRLKEQKDAYRLSLNLISQNELRNLGNNKELSDAIYAEIQKLLKEENISN